MKKRKLSFKKCFIAFLLLVLLIAGGAVGLFYYNLTPVDKDGTIQRWEILEGTNSSEIISNLESDGLIRNALVFKLYVKFYEPNLIIKAGAYRLSPAMSVEEIVTEFKEEKYEREETKTVTFKEGLTIPKMIRVMHDEFGITEEEVLTALKDSEYIDSLIEKYWFLTDEIKNKEIYYPLEGYLFPDTYEFYANSSAKDVFSRMLDQTDVILTKYKDDIDKSEYSVHQLLTIASITQSEGTESANFDKIASVLYNRINDGMKLECCTTAYYGDKKIMGEDEFGDSYEKKNAYNTYVIDALPVGPISNPGESAIKAAIKPAKTDYYFFLSDSSLKLYFSKTYNEHINKQNELISKGMWSGS